MKTILYITAEDGELFSITIKNIYFVQWNPKEVSPPNGFVLKLNGENYTTYDDLLRLISFW